MVTGQHVRSRTGIMDGLRSFIEVDNHSAVDIGELRRGIRLFHVRKSNFSEDFFAATIRLRVDVLTSES